MKQPETQRQQLNGCGEFMTALDVFLRINPPGNTAVIAAVEDARIASTIVLETRPHGDTVNKGVSALGLAFALSDLLKEQRFKMRMEM